MVMELELRVRCLIEWSMEPVSKLWVVPFPNLPATLFEATLIIPQLYLNAISDLKLSLRRKAVPFQSTMIGEASV
jgi:hypothetical protein